MRRHHISLHRVFEGLIDNCVIVDNRVCRDRFQLFCVELLDVSGFKIAQCDFLLFKVRSYRVQNHVLIRTECRYLHTNLYNFEPLLEILREQHICGEFTVNDRRLKGVAEMY